MTIAKLFAGLSMCILLGGCSTCGDRRNVDIAGDGRVWVDGEIKGIVESIVKNRGKVSERAELFSENVEEIDDEILLRLMFCKSVVKVERPNGDRRPNAGNKWEDCIFYSEPLVERGGSVLMFICSFSPGRLTILEVKNDLDCSLVYDDSERKTLDKDHPCIDPLKTVTQTSALSFVLVESDIPSDSRCSFSPGSFKLNWDVNEGKWAVKRVKN